MFKILPLQAILLTVCVTVCMCVCVCVCTCVPPCMQASVHVSACTHKFALTALVLCIVVSYVRQFGGLAHKRVHYYVTM